MPHLYLYTRCHENIAAAGCSGIRLRYRYAMTAPIICKQKKIILLGKKNLRNVIECCRIQSNQITNKNTTMPIFANQSVYVKLDGSDNIIKNIISLTSKHQNESKPLTQLVTIDVSSLYLHLCQLSNFFSKQIFCVHS